MKKKLLHTALFACLFCGTALAAQESDSTVSVIASTETEDGTSEVRVYNNVVSRTINIGTSGEKDTHWNLNLFGFSTSSSKASKSSDKENYSEYRERQGMSVSVADRIYLGWTGLASSDFDINPASSWEWGFGLLNVQDWNRQKTFGVDISLMLSRSSYRMKDDDALHMVDGHVVVDDELKTRSENPIDYKRQRLIYWTWRVPVLMQFRPASKSVRFTLGADMEMRHHIRSRAKVGSERKYYLSRRDLDINPFGYNVIAGIGNDNFTVFGRIPLSDLFDDNVNGIQARPFTVGINFYL